MSAAAGSKEAELVTAVLLYAIRSLAEGDQHVLRAMNFGPKEIAALRELNLADLYRAGSLKAHCLDIRLNRAIYWPLIAHLRRQRESEAIQCDLIQADAPLEMMRRFFGLGSREYTRLRRLLAAEPAVGRPPGLDEATSHALWRAWSERAHEDPTTPLAPEDYLSLHRQTGAPLRALWSLSQRWAQYGDLTGEAERTPRAPEGPASASPAAE